MLPAGLTMLAYFLAACAVLIVAMGWTGVLAIGLIACFAIPVGLAAGR